MKAQRTLQPHPARSADERRSVDRTRCREKDRAERQRESRAVPAFSQRVESWRERAREERRGESARPGPRSGVQ
eukprot:2921077-Prymnesium_polylepis.1